MANKDIIKLRRRPMKDGGYSLYLDCYRNGVRTYEFLHLYLVPEKTRFDKDRNKVTLASAKTIQSRRIVALAEGEAGIKHQSKDRFTNVIDDYISMHTESGSSYRKIFRTARAAWVDYAGDKIMLQDIGASLMQGFAKHLSEGNLADSSVRRYYDLICTVINDAHKKGLCTFDTRSVVRPKTHSAQRHHLSIEEVRRLSETPCPDDMMKRAFLFMCFTGLRISDLRALEWKDVNGGTIEIRMKKTREVVVIPLSANARVWLPERGDGPVFPLKGETQCYRYLKAWGKEAGVSGLTFHVARHTFATLLLTYGADIYTVSKLLGHVNVSTTQIYAKIVDEKKVKAVDAIPGL